MSFSDRGVTQQDRRALLQSLSSRLQMDSRIFELEDRVYNQNKNDIHQYTLLVNQEANRIIQQRSSSMPQGQGPGPNSQRMQQNPHQQSMQPQQGSMQPQQGSMSNPRMPQQSSQPHMQNPMLSQRQPQHTSMYQTQTPMHNYPGMQQRNSQPPQYSRQRSPGTQSQMGMYSSTSMQPQQHNFSQYPPAPQQYMQSMGSPSHPYPPYSIPQTQGGNGTGGYGGHGGPSPGGNTSYTSYPTSTPMPPSYPTNNISYRQTDQRPPQAAQQATIPATASAPAKKDNIEEFKTKANEMKAKYLAKLNGMIKDVDKIKSEETKGTSAESKQQFEEIQKKLTLLKTLITADFKPNSNFPPRKEILEAAEKQIAMWIKEWDKLMRFANGNTQTQSGAELPAGGTIKSEGYSDLSANGSKDFPQVGNPTPPPPMMTNFAYTQDGFDQDISALLDLDNFSSLDFPLMQGSISSSNASGNGIPAPNPARDYRGQANSGHDPNNYQDYQNEGSFQENNFQDNYNGGTNAGDPNNNQYQGGNGTDSGYQQNTGDPNNYQDSGDQYQNDRNSTYPHQDNYDQSEYSGDLQDDKSNIDTFDDLDLSNPAQVLGKRKPQHTETYFEPEQPSKYSKTEPM